MLSTSWMAFVLAALKALPELVALVSAFKASADAKTNQGIGYDLAIADGFKTMTAQLTQADQAVAEARANQASHPGSDDGRDTQFRRD